VYVVWIKIDETLPSIELKGKYPTKKEAKKAAQEILSNIRIEIVRVAERRESIKALAIPRIKRT
jgi:hypothetical protein